MIYKPIVLRYEAIAKTEIDLYRRVGWNNDLRAVQRYNYICLNIAQMLKKDQRDLTIFDIGCGLCALYTFILKIDESNGRRVNYYGFDASSYLVGEARLIHPDLRVEEYDFLNPVRRKIHMCDIAVLNGVFTQKFSLRQQEMFDYLKEMIAAVKSYTKSTIMFNVMSDRVDYVLDAAFHLSRNEISQMSEELKFKDCLVEEPVDYEYYVTLYV